MYEVGYCWKSINIGYYCRNSHNTTVTTWGNGTEERDGICVGTEALRGGGGRLGGWDLRLCMLCKGGRGSLSSTDMSSRSG